MIALFQEDPSPWFVALGRSHPVVLHLPLGLIPAMALLEYGAALFRRENPRGPILALAWLCAVFAGLATASGLVLAGEGGYTGETVGNHKIAGIALGVLSLLTAITAGFRKRAAFRILLLLTLAVMVPAGHLGGTITHGEDFLIEPFLAKKNAPDGNGGGEPDAPPPEPVSEFERVIAPILERTCTKCHNPDKQKGELLLTTPEGIMKGGEYGEVVVPGDPDKSELLQRCLLPLDDDDHMPPSDKPQPTAEELEKLRAWIAGGAKFD